MNEIRNGYIIDTLSLIDIQEILKVGGKVNQISEAAVYQKISTYYHLQKFWRNYSTLNKNFKTKKMIYCKGYLY